MPETLSGRPLAKQILANISEQTSELKSNGVIPVLAVVIATEDEGAWWYVRSIEKTAASCGIQTKLVELSKDADTIALATALQQLADDTSVCGILLQTPLPAEVKIDDLLPLIPAEKDVDGASPESAGKLLYGQKAFAPATAETVLRLLDYYDVALPGQQAVVVGRSRIVGRPAAHLLLERDATVTICHSRSGDLQNFTRTADILVVAAGRANLIDKDNIKPDSIVIDVGTNVNEDGQLVGDVNPTVAEIASLTPVPGGVGPVTTALILQHTLEAFLDNSLSV